MVLTFLFHLGFAVLFLGVAFDQGFQANPLLQVAQYASNNPIFMDVASALLVLSIFLPKAFRISQYSLFSAFGHLYPAAKENYLPRSLVVVKPNRPQFKILAFNLIFGLISSFLFLVLPDLLMINFNLKESIFTFTQLLGAMSIVVMVLYLVNITVALRLKFKFKKQIATVTSGGWGR